MIILLPGTEFVWDDQSSEILTPSLSWEKIGTERVGNPFVYFSPPNKEFRLYYSASSVHLNDSRIDEPIYLGLARADSPLGPWTRLSDQPLPLDEGHIDGKEILGTGSLKLVKTEAVVEEGERLVALCNRVSLDQSGRTGSSISLLESQDGGLSWTTALGDLIPPQVDVPNSWKRSYVYGFDTVLGSESRYDSL